MTAIECEDFIKKMALEGKKHSFLIEDRLVRRGGFWLGLLVLLASVAMSGWLLSRWRLQATLEKLGEERLRAESLEVQVSVLQRGQSQNSSDLIGAAGVSQGAKSSNTLLPSLDSDEMVSGGAELSDIAVEILLSRKQISFRFDLVRKPPRGQAQGYYWVGLLHGPQGVRSFPSAFASRGGDPILFHRGELLEDVRSRRGVTRTFALGDFIEKGQVEPVFMTLLIYDLKGNLLIRKRVEPFIRQSDAGLGGG